MDIRLPDQARGVNRPKHVDKSHDLSQSGWLYWIWAEMYQLVPDIANLLELLQEELLIEGPA